MMLKIPRKIILSILLVGFCFILVPLFFLTNAQYTFAASLIVTGDDLGIQLSSSDALFKVDNMAPGYQESSDITVENKGQHDFSYTISTLLNGRERMLYDLLIIEIKDSYGKIRYRGIMGGLDQELELGTVSPGGQDNYILTVYFPKEAGNEYQGKTADVNFVFNARSHSGDIEPSSGVAFERPFINSNFKLSQNSSVPIKFHLLKADGSFDTVERDLLMIIKGLDANGVPREYIFSKEKGNLKFDAALEEPHYTALLSSFDYPLKVNSSYTAIVKSGDAVLVTKDFMVDEAPSTSRSNRP